MTNDEARMTNGSPRCFLSFVIFFDSFDIRASSFTADAPASFFLSPDILRCADWLRCVSAPAPPFPGRNLQVRPPSSDCWSENGTDALQGRKGFARRARNLADRWGTRVWHSLRPCRVLPPAICTREFLLRARCHVPLAAYRPGRRSLPPEFAEALRAIGFHSRIDANRTHRQ